MRSASSPRAVTGAANGWSSAARARSFAYVLEAGLALRDYKAVVTLAPNGDGGTTINWRSTFTAKVPGTGGLYRRQLGAFIEQCVQGLAVAAGEQARAA